MSFNMLKFIETKKLGRVHDLDSIKSFINELINDNIPDYQTASWLMAVRLNSMTDAETTALTLAMSESGETIDLSGFTNTVDKHSTGGVGDKSTLILAPIVSSMGIQVIKFSGRSLDFTGGTLDKLESIPGLITSLSHDDIIKQARQIGVVLAGASQNLAPADKILYALRDVTSTVDSIPLIAASIMSKKIAGGTDSIVLDVKFGSGSFMPDYESALKLASQMVAIGKNLNKKMRAIISSMDNPLGMNVGNALEVMETIEILKGNGPHDLYEICMELACAMISLATNNNDSDTIKGELHRKIITGEAIEKFRSLINAQCGNHRVIDDYALLPTAQYRYSYLSPSDGYINEIYTRGIGNLVRAIGGGRFKKEDKIDLSVGLRFYKKCPDKVAKGDRIVDAFYNDIKYRDLIEQELSNSIRLSDNQPDAIKLIRNII